MNEKRYKSIVVLWGIIFLCLQALAIINVVGLKPNDYTKTYKLIVSLVASIMIALVIIFINLSLKKKKAGPVIGIIVGAIYTLSFTIINTIVGICFIISCADLLKGISIYREKKTKTGEKQVNLDETAKNRT